MSFLFFAPTLTFNNNLTLTHTFKPILILPYICMVNLIYPHLNVKERFNEIWKSLNDNSIKREIN